MHTCEDCLYLGSLANAGVAIKVRHQDVTQSSAPTTEHLEGCLMLWTHVCCSLHPHFRQSSTDHGQYTVHVCLL